MQGSFGYELDLSKLSEEDKAEARRQITVYNENWELFQSGSLLSTELSHGES